MALRYYFNNTSECLVLVDKRGYIVNINTAYINFLGIEPKEAIGKPVQDVIDNTRLHIVVKTGVPELDQIQIIKGNESVTTRLPLVHANEIVGALGIVSFKNRNEINILHAKINNAIQERNAYKERLVKALGYHDPLDNIIGESQDILELKNTIMRISGSDSTVLITGETGTGKEVFANAIQETSMRKGKKFLKINCAAIPENILESELFGYEDGAFTGAKKGGKIGTFEMADGGTIFLDEIGDMGVAMQAKILRVLQEQVVERVGGYSPKKIDIRVIAATNHDLIDKIKKGSFRKDLYFRLNVVSLKIPPLRDRPDDIIPLCEHFIKLFNRKFGIYIETIDDAAIECLKNYRWPGNVRELENVIENAYNFVDSKHIGVKQLSETIAKQKVRRKAGLSKMMEEYEKDIIKSALEECLGNKSKAAKMLEINRTNLYHKLEKYNL